MGVTTGDDSRYVSFSHQFSLEDQDREHITPYSYRPFDIRFIYYEPNLIARARYDFMKNLAGMDNYSICLIRRTRGKIVTTPLITKGITDKCVVSSLDNANIFPLYTYLQTTSQQTIEDIQKRKPNLNNKIVDRVAKGLGIPFVNEKIENVDTFSPIDLLDYIYAVLHSPRYRETYKEFLKNDFPLIPYPKDVSMFWYLVKTGSELRQIHSLESLVIENHIANYPIAGDNNITRRIVSKDWELLDSETGRIWINENQYFDGIPLLAWEFFFGGYQPAQKWLKDRFGRLLSYDDITHYQKIVVALSETDRLMKAIDKIKSD